MTELDLDVDPADSLDLDAIRRHAVQPARQERWVRAAAAAGLDPGEWALQTLDERAAAVLARGVPHRRHMT